MAAQIIDGKKTAADLRQEIKVEAEKLAAAGNRPGLAVIIVGENPASQVYVRNKEKQSVEVGFHSVVMRLPEETAQDELLQKIDELNADDSIHGILVQLPLPKHIDESAVIMAIDPQKDVDCFHPMNTGALFSGAPVFMPCTPMGCMELLKRYDIPVSGKRAVVIGRSNIVGKPMAMLLLAENATVTICHSRTQNLADICREADILVVAIGRANFVTADMIKPGAVVLDVGMNRNELGKLCGDVDTAAAKEVAGYITPVPGGVGPMTIAELLKNTLESAKRHG